MILIQPPGLEGYKLQTVVFKFTHYTFETVFEIITFNLIVVMQKQIKIF